MSERVGWLEEIVGSVRCAACGAAYGRDDLRVAGRRDEHWLIQCDCAVCGRQGVESVIAERAARHVSTAGHRPPPLTVDDVLDAHELLEAHSGDAHGLFARGR